MDPLLESLNEAQLTAVTHTDGPLLIVAGAGTGKTTVLTRRYAHLLKNEGGVAAKPEQILALTFTEKAAGEMEDRVIKLLPTGTYDFWISTFHGFCQRVLEQHGLEIGLPNSFRLLTPTDAWLLMRKHIEVLPLDHYRPLGNPVKFLRGLLQHISRAKDEGITPEQYASFVQNAVLDGDGETAQGEKKRLQELADLYATYRKLLLDQGALDFGDLILETLRLFRERPNVLAYYQNQFRFVMVDEFQDTNWAQYELLKLLTAKSRNLTVVGDDDQAIYKFRGASLANILQFRDDFPDAKTVALTQNYRSFKEILDTAYSFIKHNDPNRLEVRLKDTGLSKQLEAHREAGGSVQVIWKKTVEDEADAVADEMKRLKALDPESTWNDFAVLVRSNDGAEPFVHAFDRAGVPFQFMALRGLYGKPTVLDVLALLRLLDGYHESPSVWRALNLSCYPTSSKDVAELLQYANRKGISLWTALKQCRDAHISEDGVRIVEKLVSHVEGLAEAAKRETPLRVLQLALEKSGYLGRVMGLPEQEKREAVQHLNGLAERVKRYERSSHGPTIRGFLDELQQEIDSGEEGGLDFDPDAGPELVKILTVHAAKGLEFKHVFVVSLVDQRFPTRGRSDAIPLPDGLVAERLPEGDVHLEEERRLFYVALTRAKDRLYLTGAAHYGGTRAKKPSSFFVEAGQVVNEAVNDVTADIMRLKPHEPEIDKRADLIHYELKKKFSFTQLATFRKCPYSYKLEHIYRIPKFGTYQKSFGQSVHRAYQRMVQLHQARGQSAQGTLFGDATQPTYQSEGGFRVSLEEALALYEETWIDEWYESRARHDEYKAKGKQAVKNFWQACAKKAPDIMGVEVDFTLVLGLHSLKGKVDRIDRCADGTVAIVDYKTGTAKEELTAEEKEQLHLYQIALEEKGMKVSSLRYIYVLDWVETPVDPLSGDKREAFMDKLSERMEAIAASEFLPTPEPFTCKFCDFRNICEFKKV